MANDLDPLSPSSPFRPRQGADQRGVELGTARWSSPDEVRGRCLWDDRRFALRSDRLWEGRSNGQICIGESIEEIPGLLGYADDRHVCLVSGSRGGKGTSFIIPNLCFWPGSCLVIDPKGENANVTARRRGQGSPYCLGLGQDVVILDPFGEVQLEESFKARYNPLDVIDPWSDCAVDDAGRLAASLVVSEGTNKDPFFEDSSLTLIKVLILHVLTALDFGLQRNLVTVWRLVNQGDWQGVEELRKAGKKKVPSPFEMLWEGMKASHHYNGLIAGLGQEMLDMSDRTRDGIRKTAATHLDFISGPPMQRLLETSDFDLADIKNNPKGTTIYLTLPQRYMKTHFRWLRMMTDLAIGEMERIKSKPATQFPTLFLLDEFAGLKRMEIIEHAAAQAAGLGVKFFFVVQSLVQLKEVYKESWETFLGNSGLKIYFNVEDDFTRSYLSRQLGEREIRRQTQTGSRTDGEGHSTTEGQSRTTTEGTGSSRTESRGSGTSWTTSGGESAGWSDGTSFQRSSGGSAGDSTNRDLDRLIFKGSNTGHSTSTGSNYSNSRGSNTSRSGGSNWSTSGGKNRSFSNSRSHSKQTSTSSGSSSSVTTSRNSSTTEGWSEGVHKRFLLNPDEIGRFFAPTADRAHPAYPGLVAAFIIGQHPMLVRRVNYYECGYFTGFFDPHPDHPPPPTLAELIRLRRPKRAPRSKPASTQSIQAGSLALPARRPGGRARRWLIGTSCVGLVLALGYNFLWPHSHVRHLRRIPYLAPGPAPAPAIDLASVALKAEARDLFATYWRTETTMWENPGRPSDAEVEAYAGRLSSFFADRVSNGKATYPRNNFVFGKVAGISEYPGVSMKLLQQEPDIDCETGADSCTIGFVARWYDTKNPDDTNARIDRYRLTLQRYNGRFLLSGEQHTYISGEPKKAE